jgi:hypothetical protein
MIAKQLDMTYIYAETKQFLNSDFILFIPDNVLYYTKKQYTTIKILQEIGKSRLGHRSCVVVTIFSTPKHFFSVTYQMIKEMGMNVLREEWRAVKNNTAHKSVLLLLVP